MNLFTYYRTATTNTSIKKIINKNIPTNTGIKNDKQGNKNIPTNTGIKNDKQVNKNIPTNTRRMKQNALIV